MKINKYQKLSILIVVLGSIFITGCGGGGNSPDTFSPDNTFGPNNRNDGYYSKVVDVVANILKDDAFAFKADFDQAPAKLAKHKALLAQAPNDYAFAVAFNKVIEQEFNVSHTFLGLGGKGKKDDALYPFPDYKLGGRAHSGLPTLNSFDIGSQKGYIITIGNFSEGYQKYIINTFFNTIPTNAPLIIDVRGNPGGLVSNLQHLISFFAPDNSQDGYDIQRKMAEDFIASGKVITHTSAGYKSLVDYVNVYSSKFFIYTSWLFNRVTKTLGYSSTHTGPIIVLMDKGSASCSEHLAIYLKEERNAKIVGEKSAGALLSSVTKPLGSFTIQYPIADYLSTKCTRVEGVGVSPTSGFSTSSFRALSVAKHYLQTGNILNY